MTIRGKFGLVLLIIFIISLLSFNIFIDKLFEKNFKNNRWSSHLSILSKQAYFHIHYLSYTFLYMLSEWNCLLLHKQRFRTNAYWNPSEYLPSFLRWVCLKQLRRSKHHLRINEIYIYSIGWILLDHYTKYL